jgi:hypothetical protein
VTGPIPITDGSHPVWANATILAKGLRLRLATSSLEARRTAAAESLIPKNDHESLDGSLSPLFDLPEAFPAVTDPSLIKQGLSLVKLSRVVPSFKYSSFDTTIVSLRLGTGTDTIS